MNDARLLVDALRDPAGVTGLDPDRWNALLALARAEVLTGTLAHRLAGLPIPAVPAAALADAQVEAAAQRRAALHEAECARAALRDTGVVPVLLKGTAYAAAGLSAGQGRAIGDLDILVPRAALPAVEAALLAHGWDWLKPDAYDDHYYRRWMHELPPLAHRSRDRLIDVHHSILPLTARETPDAAALLADAMPAGAGLATLSVEDMIVHAACHLFADGDLAGGLRNLWDVRCLLEDFGGAPAFGAALQARAAHHGLLPAVRRAVRLAGRLYGAAVPDGFDPGLSAADAIYVRRLLACDGWGRERRPALRAGFYLRSHIIRMPLPLLARHLAIKAMRRGRA